MADRMTDYFHAHGDVTTHDISQPQARPSSAGNPFQVGPSSLELRVRQCFSIPIPINMLEHVKVVGHRPDISLIQQIMCLVLFSSEPRLINLLPAIHPIHNQHGVIQDLNSCLFPAKIPSPQFVSSLQNFCLPFFIFIL